MTDSLTPEDQVAKQPKRVWILYVNDGDAEIGEPFDSAILECEGSGSRRALRKMLAFWRGQDAILYEYDEVGKNLENERMIGNLREGMSALLGKCK